MKSSRRLAAIMFTDIVGYTALMSDDEAKAFAVLSRNRSIHNKQIKRFHGQWLKEIGDGVLASFETVTDAVCCAAAIQKECKSEPELSLRIGIHQGEVVFENGDVFGDGVNIASRIESHAPPGAIFVSRTVYQNISNNREIEAVHFEDATLKNISYKVGIYEVKISDPNYLESVAAAKVGEPEVQKSKWLLPSVGLLLLISISVIAWWVLAQGTNKSGEVETTEIDKGAESKSPGVALPTGPKIAVLPFKNLSNDKEQEYFSDGLTEDIITALSHTDLFVLGFSPNLHEVSEKSITDIGNELGVRYILRGSVRRDANTLRVSSQLFDTGTGVQIWDESYSRDLTVSNIFEVQDDITMRVAGVLADGGFIAKMDLEELKRNPTSEMAAYDCVLRSYVYEGIHTEEAHLLARDCVESAIELDSTYADALGIAAYLYREEHFHDFNQRPNALENAMTTAKKAIDIDPLNQNAYHALAFIYADLGVTEKDNFFAAATRAIELNPNNTRVIGGIGVLIAFAGEWEWGVELLDKTVNINPYTPLIGWRHYTRAVDYFNKGAYSDALAEINQSSSVRLAITQITHIAIHVQLGNREEATIALKKAMSDYPLFLENARSQLEHFFPGGWQLHNKHMEGLETAVLSME